MLAIRGQPLRDAAKAQWRQSGGALPPIGDAVVERGDPAALAGKNPDLLNRLGFEALALAGDLEGGAFAVPEVARTVES